MIKQLFAVLSLAFLFGCSTKPAPIQMYKPEVGQQQKQHSLLVGKWYGESVTNDGGKILSISDIAKNGTFKISFRITEKSGETWDQTEVGDWGVAGNTYFTITKGFMHGEKFSAENPQDPGLSDAYQIIELTNEKLHYKSVETGDEYTAVKVETAFQFPLSKS